MMKSSSCLISSDVQEHIVNIFSGNQLSTYVGAKLIGYKAVILKQDKILYRLIIGNNCVYHHKPCALIRLIRAAVFFTFNFRKIFMTLDLKCPLCIPVIGWMDENAEEKISKTSAVEQQTL